MLPLKSQGLIELHRWMGAKGAGSLNRYPRPTNLSKANIQSLQSVGKSYTYTLPFLPSSRGFLETMFVIGTLRSNEDAHG